MEGAIEGRKTILEGRKTLLLPLGAQLLQPEPPPRPAEPDLGELHSKLEALNNTIAGLAPLAADDVAVAAVQANKREARAHILKQLIERDPLSLDLMLAMQARDKALARQKALTGYEQRLREMLLARREELGKADEEVALRQAEVDALTALQLQADQREAQLQADIDVTRDAFDGQEQPGQRRLETEVSNLSQVAEAEAWNLLLERNQDSADMDDILQDLPDRLRKDREFVISAVSRQGMALSKADPALKADRDVVLAAVRNKGGALRFADESLKADREVVLTAVQGSRPTFLVKDFAKLLTSEKDLMVAAVGSPRGLGLQFADASLRADRELVLQAVREDGLNLQHATEALRADKEVVLAAVGQTPAALRFAKGGLLHDPDCRKAAGLGQVCEEDDEKSQAPACQRTERVVLSVKFGSAEEVTPYARAFAQAMSNDRITGQFQTYEPDSWGKRQSLIHSRSEDQLSCAFESAANAYASILAEPLSSDTGVSMDSRPPGRWRAKFGQFVEECKASGGFMVQAEERSGLGAGQRIEINIAEQLGLKVFRTYTNLPWFTAESGMFRPLGAAIKTWYDSGCTDSALEHVFIGSTGMPYEAR